MKIEIDLDDVFRDEEGGPAESVQESVRRQIIDRLSGDMRKRLFARLDEELSTIMREQISVVMVEKMPELIDDIMNVKYTPVSTYGQRGEPTTFRDEIIKAIGANMVYAPKSYSSEENTFTRAVKSVVEAKTDGIKKELLATIDAQFKRDALAFAVKQLAERLGLPK